MSQVDLNSIRQLSSLGIPRDEFYAEFLQQLVTGTGAEAGVTWSCLETPFIPIAQHLPGEGTTLQISEQAHSDILTKVHQQQKSAVVRTGKAEQDTDNPVIILAPVVGNDKALVELVIPPSKERPSDNALLTLIDEACGIAATRVNAGASLNHSGPFSVEDFSKYTHNVHKSIDRKLTCANVANETRRLLDCDRVTVIMNHRGKFRIESISGQPSVNRRSNSNYLLQRFARAVLKIESPFWYPEEENISPQIKKSLDKYLEISATRSLVVHPIREQVEETIEDPEGVKKKSNPVIGGIIYEHCNEQWNRNVIEKTLNLTTQHGADAIRNASQHHSLFLFPLWNLLSKSKVLVSPRYLSKTLMVVAGILALAAFLCLWRVPFYVSASGELIPQERQMVFAQSSGDVERVRVDHGSMVAKGQTLLKLKNDNLKIQIEDRVGQIEVLKRRRSAIESKRFGVERGGRSESESLDSLVSQIESLERQVELLRATEAKLEVKSPLDGQVITWDVKRKLKGRTVEPSLALMEIANPDGPWQIELDVEDRRVGHLLKSLNESGDQELKVMFSLAAEPSKTYEGKLVEVGNAMRVNAENNQVVRVIVEVDKDQLTVKQARTGTTAKIYCGYKTSIGYLMFHEVSEAYQRYVAFYFRR